MSAGGAGAAAAAAIRRQHEEEESMTGYTAADLAEGWEFKILRSATGAFRNPQRLKEALEQEARSGWVLVEKFDSSRIRLKRPASARARDTATGPDAYGTTFGMHPGLMVAAIIGTVVALLAAVALIAVLMKRP